MLIARRLFFVLLPFAIVFYAADDGRTLFHRGWIILTNAQTFWETSKDIQGAAGTTAMHLRATGKLPDDFSTFLIENRRNVARSFPPHVDAWHTAYRLVPLGGHYEIVSCGPDADCDTAVDNLVERGRMVEKAPPSAAQKELDKALQQALE